MENIKFNKWTILRQSGKDRWGSLIVFCRCDCLREANVRLSDLKSNKSMQCIDCGYKFGRSVSVVKSPLAGKGNNYRHGLSDTKIYDTWCKMIRRCSAMNGKDYKWYGARGIKVCEEWLKFESFYRDMGDRPVDRKYIDRIDNDLGYSKENCRWVDAVLNSRNRRNVKNKGEL